MTLNQYSILTYLGLIALIAQFCFAPFDGIEPGIVTGTLAITLGAVALHLFNNRNPNWMRIDTIFILGFLIVNFQWPVMHALFGLDPYYQFQQVSLSGSGGFAVLLATLAMVSWLLGYALARKRPGRERYDRVGRHAAVGPLHLAALAAFAVLAGDTFFAREIYTTITFDRVQTVTGEAAYLLVIVEILARLALATALYVGFVLHRNASIADYLRDKSLLLKNVSLLVFAVIFMLGGERGQVVMVAMSAALAYAHLVRPIRLPEFAALILAGFALMTLVAYLRTGADLGSATEALTSYGTWSVTANLADSFVTLTQAVEMTRSNHTYALGQLWLAQFLGVIPLFQSLFISQTGMELADMSSALAISTYTLGASLHTGLGSSFVADIYLNSGPVGLIVFPAIFGFACFHAGQWLYGRSGFIKFYIATIMAGYILYISRSTMLDPLRPIVWGLLVALILLSLRRLMPERTAEPAREARALA
ncbi:MAG: O-antigen polysaccharide polymerase Wzy [Caulobacterales bacterium]|uniref:O-antigen polysaccharide polymerase Wzy n=1 Tax=Glycocaulis sp. TaxID=1969725 RepID=UPI003FA0E91F